MNHPEDYTPCQWPQCNIEAHHHVHYEYESIFVCRAHREAVKVNIETCGKIWIFKDQEQKKAEAPRVRPGEQKPRYKGAPVAAPPMASKPDWRQVAAKRADAAAVPVEGNPEFVQPRKRTQGDAVISKILGDSVRPG